MYAFPRQARLIAYRLRSPRPSCAALFAMLICSGMCVPLLSARQISTDRFANVFLEGEAVRVVVEAGDATVIRLCGVDSEELARQEVASEKATVDFGSLPPGYYEAVAGDTVLKLVVLIDPARRVPGESRLATDNAMSWLVPAEQWEAMAKLLRWCGIGWVRERLNWGEVERERGQLDWGRYDRTANVLHGQGIKVYQVFHSIPGWARVDKDHRAAPDDLREMYRFTQALAENFRGRVQAWEVWNEPDIFFFSHTSSECAALQKAAYLGFQSVDPQLRVLGPSMAHGAGVFSEGLLENGVADYLDIWNFHIYADPSSYAARRAGFRQQLARYGVNVPDWITEAGDRREGPEGVLTGEGRRHQAEFLSRAFPQALATGIERHFWFVFPYYIEGENGWGLFEPGQKAPYPGLAALSATTYALGRGGFLGTMASDDQDVRVYGFARGDGTAALAVWRESDEPADVTLPLAGNQVLEVISFLGTPMPVDEGPLKLRLARGAAYVLASQATLEALLTPSDPGAPIAAETESEPDKTNGLRKVVARLKVLDGKPDKAVDAYRVDASAPVNLEAELYNFDDAAFEGEACLSAPDGCELSPSKVTVRVEPGERTAVPIQLTVPAQLEPLPIRLVARAAANDSAPAIVRVCVSADTLSARESLALALDAPERWQKNIAGHGTMEVSAGDEGGVRFLFKFSRDGDNWAYPRVSFSPILDLSEYDAVRFEYRTDSEDAGEVRMILFEPGDVGYISDAKLPGDTQWRSATVPLKQLGHVAATRPDDNSQLDLNEIANLSVGAHCEPTTLVLEVRNIQAVKF